MPEAVRTERVGTSTHQSMSRQNAIREDTVASDDEIRAGLAGTVERYLMRSSLNAVTAQASATQANIYVYGKSIRRYYTILYGESRIKVVAILQSGNVIPFNGRPLNQS